MMIFSPTMKKSLIQMKMITMEAMMKEAVAAKRAELRPDFDKWDLPSYSLNFV